MFYIIGYSQSFDTYYYLNGKAKTIFNDINEARNYLKKFIRSKFSTNKVESLIWFIGQGRVPLHIFKYFTTIFNYEYKINDLLTMKLEDGNTVIYVDNTEFLQCKYLLFSFDKENVEEYEEIRSIDEAKQKLDGSMEGFSASRFHITPLTEFWGHCSNIEVWAENGYDTRLLERTMAFPLLRKLALAGDKIAIRQLKEEVCLRFEEGIDSTRLFLIIEGYLSNFSKDEFESLFRSVGKQYEDGIFWEKITFKQIENAFNILQSRDTIFIYCPTHEKIANLYGRIDNDKGVGFYLNCGCELFNRLPHTKFEVTVVKALRK